MAQLDDMQVFAAVAEAGGFRPAAQRIGLPASTVSDVVRRVEDAMGVRLLERNTRSVTPTDAGRRLLNGLRPALAAIEQTVAGLKGDVGQLQGRLRLTVPEIVARYILPDVLAGFLIVHPGIEVDVATDNAVVDIVDAGFDAAIRYEERVARDMIAVPIGPPVQRYVAAAAPAYLRTYGLPEEPSHLALHRLIGHRFPDGRARAWEFAKGRRRKKITPTGSIIATSVDLRLAAAVAGAGVIYTFDEVVRPLINDGELTVILEDWSLEFSGPRLCYHAGRHVPAPLQAFLEFVRVDRSAGASVR